MGQWDRVCAYVPEQGRADGKRSPGDLIKRPSARKRGPIHAPSPTGGRQGKFLHFSVPQFPGESEYFLPHRFSLKIK